MEQVFAPHPFSPGVKAHVKGSPLYADLQLVGPGDGKRGQPSWTLEEFKRNSGEKGKHLTALDLQVLDHKGAVVGGGEVEVVGGGSLPYLAFGSRAKLRRLGVS